VTASGRVPEVGAAAMAVPTPADPEAVATAPLGFDSLEPGGSGRRALVPSSGSWIKGHEVPPCGEFVHPLP